MEKTTNKILLVEDYGANILVVTTLLEGFGYDYAVAKDGQEALQKLQEENFAVALMDIQMPDMDGMEITRHIRTGEKKGGKSRMQIIAMTAHALSGDRERFLGAGMDDYISKPFNPEELEAKLKMHVKNYRHNQKLCKAS